MNIFEKIKFLLRRPKLVIVTGDNRTCTKEAIFQVLNKYFKIGKEILIFETDLKKEKKLDFLFLIKYSSLPILVVAQIGDIPPKIIPDHGWLILNFDDEKIREIPDIANLKTFTFGFQEGADFQATDVKLNSGTNFKVNYEGNVVPIWLEKSVGKEQIYSALAATAVGIILGLNLIEISQALKIYHCK